MYIIVISRTAEYMLKHNERYKKFPCKTGAMFEIVDNNENVLVISGSNVGYLKQQTQMFPLNKMKYGRWDNVEWLLYYNDDKFEIEFLSEKGSLKININYDYVELIADSFSGETAIFT